MTKTIKTLKQQAFQQGVSASFIAKELGVPTSTITRVFNGQRGAGIDLVERIAKVLDLELKIICIFET